MQDQANRERRARKKVNLDCIKQVALAGIGGFVSGAGMGAIGFAVSNARNKVFTLSDIENSEADVASYVFIDSENIEEKSTAIDKAYSEVLKNGKSVEISNELLEKYETISKNPVVKLKDAIKEFYDLHIKGKSVRVEVRNGVIEIAFENDGKKKSVGWRMKPDKAATFERLLELTGNSVYAYSEYNRDTNEATSIPYFHYFMGDAVINGEHIPVKIQVRNIAADKSAIRARYYTHNLINKKGTESDSPVAGAKSANIDSNAYTSVPESTIPQSGSDVNTENTQAGVGVTIEEAGPPADGNAEALIDYGNEQSTASLGIRGGSRTDSIRLVTAGETISVNEAKDMAWEYGLTPRLFGGGNLHINGRAIQAHIQDGVAYVRVDAPNKKAAQLMRELTEPLRAAQAEAQRNAQPTGLRMDEDDWFNEQEIDEMSAELQMEELHVSENPDIIKLNEEGNATDEKNHLWVNDPSAMRGPRNGGAKRLYPESSIRENASTLKTRYPYNNGYFGVKGASKTNSKVRHITSENPQKAAEEFYKKIAYGGIEEPIYNKKTGELIGWKTKLADGSVITWRSVSSSDGSPTININIEKSSDSGGVKQQKIHFIRGR